MRRSNGVPRLTPGWIGQNSSNYAGVALAITCTSKPRSPLRFRFFSCTISHFPTQVVAAAASGVTMLLGTTVVMLTAMSLTAPLAKLNLAVGLGVQLAVVTSAAESHAAGPTFAARLALSVLAPVGATFLAPSEIRRAAFKPILPRNWPPGFARYSRRTLVAGLVTTLVFSRCEILVLDAYGDIAAAALFALAAGLAAQTSPRPSTRCSDPLSRRQQALSKSIANLGRNGHFARDSPVRAGHRSDSHRCDPGGSDTGACCLWPQVWIERGALHKFGTDQLSSVGSPPCHRLHDRASPAAARLTQLRCARD